ncbi:MAG TPA: DNA-3-methyladenine glycosylase [Phycisphaerales bacterium]|nr:DNA-3-methyladenine glycosylase [Phycisphaerales bacterium]
MIAERRMLTFSGSAIDTARRLLGQRLVRVVEGVRLAAVIVEVEAYLGEEDAASHTYKGRRTARNESMYLAGGHAYVYMIYGMHHCLNVVCGRQGVGTAVLIRAAEPCEGVEIMAANRGVTQLTNLCSGPGKLAQAMCIDRSLDGEDLRVSEHLFIEQVRKRALPSRFVQCGPRIGVAYAGEWAAKPLRYFVTGNSHVSC